MSQKAKFFSAAVAGFLCLAFFLVAFANEDTESSVLLSQEQPLSSRAGGASGGRVRFAVIGDFGSRGKAEEAVATMVAEWDPDFIVTLGDNNYPDGQSSTMDRNVGELYHDYIYPFRGTFATPTPDSTPGPAENRFWPILGNHDWHALTVSNGNVTGPYLDYFTLPNNERYYDLVRGPVHFFMLDSDGHEPDGTSQNSVQAHWLQTHMASSNAPWKLVLLHYAPYSSSTHGSTTKLQWPYKDWGADAVLAGHDHVYERLEVNNLPYFVNGLGGAGRYTFQTPVAGSLFRYADNPGAMLIDATDSSITFQMVITNGLTIDQFTLTKSPATSTPGGINHQLFLPMIDNNYIAN